MSFLFGKKQADQPQAQQTQPINALRINESVRGKVVPVSRGMNRNKQFLIWEGEFTPIPHQAPSTQTGGGGKSGGGGSTIPGQLTYTYTCAYQGGICFGPIDHIANVWTNGGRVGVAVFTDTFVVPPGGGTHRPTRPNPIKGIGVAMNQSFDSGVITDFGASASTHLTGTFAGQVATAATPSTGIVGSAVDGTGQIWTIGSDFAGQTLLLSYTANLQAVWTEVEIVIPAGIGAAAPTFTVDSPSTFIGWSSIVSLTGTPFFGPYPAGTTLTTTQFIATGAGVFTFATADVGKTITITYQSTDTSVTPGTTLNFSTLLGTEGQSPWAYMAAAHPTQAVSNSGLATVQSSLLDLGSDPSIPQLSFETICSPGFQMGPGQTDCNPQDVIYSYLTDNNCGVGFPPANIEFNFTLPATGSTGVYLVVPFLTSPQSNAQAFWAANGFFISPLVENQTTVAAEIQTYLDAGQCALLFSEGLLKLRPYGDTTAAANGAIYVPLTQPVVDFNDDDFIAAAGSDPIKVTRASWDGSFNKVQIEFSDRASGYNSEVITEEDPASIMAYSAHIEDPQQWSFLKTYSAAQVAANWRVRRLSNIRNTYTFSVPPTYDYLEPMDITTITNSVMGFNFLPVRIISVEDDPATGLNIIAEDFPYGVAQAAIYPKQQNIGFHDSPATHEPGNTTPLILEIPDPLAQYAGNVIRIYATPVDSGDWGGCVVMQSFDNVTYTEAGTIRSAAVFGTLTATLGVGTGDPDTQTVTMSVADGMQLFPPTTYDFNNHENDALLTMIDSGGNIEIVGYSTATLTAKNVYTIGNFHRGLFGTTRSAHVSGATVLKMSIGHLELNYNISQVGQTMYIKTPSFNTVGGLLQDYTVLSPISVSLAGANPGMFNVNTGQVSAGSSRLLNPQGGILPNQQPASISYSYTSTVIATVWAAQSLLRADGSTLVTTASSGTNLITNGDMESGTLGSQETSWTNISSNGLITANDFVHGGTKAGKMAGGSTSLSITPSFSMTAGQIYVVEGWVKQDAMPTVPTHIGAGFTMVIDSGITSWTILTKFGAFDAGATTTPQVSLPADNTARPYTFLQCYFKPTASGTAHLQVVNQSVSGNGWYDDIKVYPYIGAIYTGLSASTAYYLYPYLSVATGNTLFANPTPPTTSPNATYASQAGLDGRIALGTFSQTTSASGVTTPTGGTGSGGPVCPEKNELIEVSRGVIKAGDVLVGDFIKGWSFETAQDVFREVLSTTSLGNRSWRVVRDKKVSPVEPVYVNDQWMPAYAVPGSTLDTTNSQKVQITVRSDDYNESNYWLVDGTPLLIHNFTINQC
jgi:hypothetical protein